MLSMPFTDCQLAQVAAMSDTNQMNIPNLATVMGPNLLYPRHGAPEVAEALKEIGVMTAIAEILMKNFDRLFLQDQEDSESVDEPTIIIQEPEGTHSEVKKGHTTKTKPVIRKKDILVHLGEAKKNAAGEASAEDLYSLLSGCGAGSIQQVLQGATTDQSVKTSEDSESKKKGKDKKPKRKSTSKRKKSEDVTDEHEEKKVKEGAHRKSSKSEKDEKEKEPKKHAKEKKAREKEDSLRDKPEKSKPPKVESIKEHYEKKKHPAEPEAKEVRTAADLLDGESKVLRIHNVREQWKTMEGTAIQDAPTGKKKHTPGGSKK